MFIGIQQEHAVIIILQMIKYTEQITPKHEICDGLKVESQLVFFSFSFCVSVADSLGLGLVGSKYKKILASKGKQ